MGNGFVVRPQDHLLLGVEWEGLVPATGPPDAPPSLTSVTDSAWLRVSFPPQHVGEQPVDWKWWGPNLSPRPGSFPPRAYLSGGHGLGWDGELVAVDAAGMVRAGEISVPGHNLVPGSPVLSHEGRLYAVEANGKLIHTDALSWAPLGDVQEATGFEPGGVLAVLSAWEAHLVFGVRRGGLVCWSSESGWLGSQPQLTIQPGAHLTGVDNGVGVATVADDRIVKVTQHHPGGEWTVARGQPHPQRLIPGCPVASAMVPDYASGTNWFFVTDRSGTHWGYEWDSSTWHKIEPGFSPGGSLQVVRTEGWASALALLAANIKGVLALTVIDFVDSASSNIEEVNSVPLGDWFPPGAPVGAVARFGRIELSCVGPDRRLRTTVQRSAGSYLFDPATPDKWEAAERLSPQPQRQAGRSHVAVRVPRGESVELTSSGVLRTIREWQVNIDWDRTSLEIPWGLRLRFNSEPKPRHENDPRTSDQGVAGVWHTRLRPANSGFLELTPANLRSDAQFGSGGTAPALDERARTELVNTTSASAFYPSGVPVVAQRIDLSPLGGWLSASCSNYDYVITPFDWSQEIVAGRDMTVRVTRHGKLLPFGHEAMYQEDTQRLIDPRAPFATAVLRREWTLTIKNPTVTYAGREPKEFRGFPFDSVTIDATGSMAVDQAEWIGPGDYFWPKHTGARLRFPVVLRQAGGREVRVETQLLFTRAHFGDVEQNAIDEVNGDGPLDLGHARVQMAGSHSFEVASLTVTTERDPVTGRIRQKITQAAIALPALTRVSSEARQQVVTFADDYLTHGTESVVFKPLQRHLKVDFGGGADASGGVAIPAFAADAISAAGGPLNTLADVGTFDPETFFDDSAKLLGFISLGEVIKEAASEPPLIETVTDVGPTPIVKVSWKNVPLNKAGTLFTPRTEGPPCTLTLHLESSLALPDPTAARADPAPVVPAVDSFARGTISNFSLGFAGVFVADVDELRFESRPGKGATLDVAGLEVRFAGKLRFLNVLEEAARRFTQSPPVAIETTSNAITMAKVIALGELVLGAPPLAVSVRGAAFSTRITLPFKGAVSLDFSFGTRKHPFLVGIWILGGGGYLEIEIGDGKIQSIVGGVEVGGLWAFDWFVVAGEIHALAGIRLELVENTIALAGYLRLGGTVEVLGIVSVSVEAVAAIEGTLEEREGREDRLTVTVFVSLVLEVDLFLVSTDVEVEEEMVIYDSDDNRATAQADALPGGGRASPEGYQHAWQQHAAVFNGKGRR